MKNFSVVDGEQIRKSALNNSASKLTYSFSREERFRSPPPNCPSVCYDHTGQLSKRGAAFGFGDKSDFTKTLTSSPPVTKYNPEEIMLSTKRSSPSKTFGINRNLCPQNGTMTHGIQKNPGVGAYQVNPEPLNNFAFTMRSRTLDVFLKNNSSRATPGPAAYKHRDQFPLDKFSSAKYENPPLGQLSKTARFMTPKQSPGPQTYMIPDDLSNKGKYVSSNRLSEGNRKFSLSSRTGFTEDEANNKKINPGPGHYQRLSEFGVYGDTNYYKTLSSFGGKMGDTASKLKDN